MSLTVHAELGSNPAAIHWDMSLFVSAAATADADGVKVQLWRPEHFPAHERAQKSELVFPRRMLTDFVRQAHAWGMTAGASVFDYPAVRLAAQTCDWLKLAAREQANTDLMAWARGTSKPVYRSISGGAAYDADWWTTMGTVQRYPLPMGAALLAVARWALFFRLRGARWGWSSHTRGAADVVLAVSLGADVIEKHLATEDWQPESGHSLKPGEFLSMTRAARKAYGRRK